MRTAAPLLLVLLALGQPLAPAALADAPDPQRVSVAGERWIVFRVEIAAGEGVDLVLDALARDPPGTGETRSAVYLLDEAMALLTGYAYSDGRLEAEVGVRHAHEPQPTWIRAPLSPLVPYDPLEHPFRAWFQPEPTAADQVRHVAVFTSAATVDVTLTLGNAAATRIAGWTSGVDGVTFLTAAEFGNATAAQANGVAGAVATATATTGATSRALAVFSARDSALAATRWSGPGGLGGACAPTTLACQHVHWLSGPAGSYAFTVEGAASAGRNPAYVLVADVLVPAAA